jgi:uncharacterized protein (TIGR02271 family)
MVNTTATRADQIFGYDVIDSAGNNVGSVDNVWVDDATNDLEFVAIKTGWIMGKTHIIPTASAQIDDDSRTITVPYTQDQIKDAPSFSGDAELSPDDENDVYGYYGVNRSTTASPTGLPADGGTYSTGGVNTDYSRGTVDTTDVETSTDRQQVNVPLSEEQLNVGKRQVEAGHVRLRKVVRSEQVEQPVELRHEEVQIERVDAGSGFGGTVPDNAFEEQEIDVPVMREEPVVEKQTQVTGQVQLTKDIETDTQNVGGTVRREDVEVDNTDGVDTDTDSNIGYAGSTTDTTNRSY